MHINHLFSFSFSLLYKNKIKSHEVSTFQLNILQQLMPTYDEVITKVLVQSKMVNFAIQYILSLVWNWLSETEKSWISCGSVLHNDEPTYLELKGPRVIFFANSTTSSPQTTDWWCSVSNEPVINISAVYSRAVPYTSMHCLKWICDSAGS